MLQAVVKHIYELPSIPKVVRDLITDFGSNSANADVISKNIQSDAVISAKVLRLANSARYGGGRKVSSLDGAVVLLGIDTLKTLVIASGVTGAFTDIPNMDTRTFWRDSFLVANFCKLIAQASNDCDPEVAFTCGMLHNIGIPLLRLAHPEDSKIIQHACDRGANRCAEEQKIFGFTNQSVAALLAKTWHFPIVIVDALNKQSAPLEADPFSPYAAAIALAKHIEIELDKEVEPVALMGGLPTELTEALHLDVDSLFKKMEKLLATEDDIDDLLAA